MRKRILPTVVLAACVAALLATQVKQILAGLTGKHMETGMEAREARQQMASLAAKLDAYRRHYGGYPSPVDGWHALVPEYLKAPPMDPWGRRFRYDVSAGRAWISTLGRDGQPGGSGADEDLSQEVTEMKLR